MNKFPLLVAILLASASAFAGNTVTLSGSNVQDNFGVKLVDGRICFQAADASGRAIGYRIGGGGQVINQPSCAHVSHGVFSVTLADTANTSPSNVCFSVSVKDSSTGKVVLGTPTGSSTKSGYDCVQPTANVVPWCSSGTCNFDSYVPNTPNVAQQVLTLPPGYNPVVTDYSATSHQFVTGFVAPNFSHAQPAFTDISGNVAIAQLASGTGASSTTCLYGDNSWKACGSGGGGSGTVNSGTSTQLAWYSGTGTAVSGNANLTDTTNYLNILSAHGNCWNADTCFWRTAAKTLSVGTTTSGDATGTLKAATVTSLVAPVNTSDATNKTYVDSATRASVVAFGAKGDCSTDDTTAFQNAINSSRSVFVPNPPGGTCYIINGVTITNPTTIELASRNTAIFPKTAATPYLFYLSGASIASPLQYTTIKGGILFANVTMNSGTYGIKVNYGSHLNLENIIINGFYDNIFVDNTFYMDLDRVFSNGSLHSALWHQHSDTTHGPYFGGPLTIRGGTYDSGSGAFLIHVTDVAVVDIDGADVVGASAGQGLYFNSSNGIPATPSDYPTGIHISGITVDSTASEPLYIQNYAKSSIVNSWFSGGRTNSKACIALQAVQNVTLTNVHGFWCGTDGLAIGSSSTQVTATSSSFAGSSGDGIHVVSASHSSFVGNTCNSTAFSGSGVTEPFCIYEEAASANNTYVGNDGNGTTNGNSYNGTSPLTLEAGGLTVPGSNGGVTFPEGTGLTPASGKCILDGRSATHRLNWNCNNGTTFQLGASEALYFATGATVTWTTQPAAVTEFLGSTNLRQQKDLSAFTQFRIIVGVSTAGAAGSKLGVQYSTDSGSTWNYLETGGGTTHEVAISGTGSPITGSWVTMNTAARGDYQLRIIGVSGDAAASPTLRTVMVEFR